MYELNYLAIIVVGIASMLIGWAWYGPLLFGKQWMALSGMTMPETMTPEMKKGMMKGYAGTFVGSLVTAGVLATVLAAFGASSMGDAFQYAFCVWLGFTAAPALGMVLWENKPWKLYFINVGYSLVFLIVASVILVVWK